MLRLAAIILLGGSLCYAKPLPQRSEKSVSSFAFGSCLDFLRDANQSFWGDIASFKPDFFLGLGDWFYSDDKVVWKWRINANEERIRRDFASQKRIPTYAAFADKIPVLGMYDDHDAGQNDVNRLFSRSVVATAQRELFNFLDEKEDSDRVKRWNENASGGQYQSYHLGSAPRRVHLILLDVRTFLDPWPEDRDSKDPLNPAFDPEGKRQDILGAQQWAWLEDELVKTEAEVTIIASGLQVLGRNDPWLAEVWAKHPQSQAKLIALLAKHSKKGVFFLSGDVHVAEVNRVSCPALGYPLYEYTSSGLTHAWSAPLQKQAWWLLMMGHTRLGGGALAQPATQPDGNDLYQGKNWGLVHIDWAEKKGEEQGQMVNDPEKTVITFEARGTEPGSPVYIRHSIKLASISPAEGAGKRRVAKELATAPGAGAGVTGKARSNYSVLLGPETAAEFASAIKDFRDRASVIQRDEKEGGSLLPDSSGYPLLVSGASVQQSDLDLDLLSAIEECAAAPLDQGHTAPCRRLMHTCSPKLRIEHRMFYLVGHAAVLLLIFVPVLGGVGSGLWLIFTKRSLARSSIGVAVIAAVLAALRKLL